MNKALILVTLAAITALSACTKNDHAAIMSAEYAGDSLEQIPVEDNFLGRWVLPDGQTIEMVRTGKESFSLDTVPASGSPRSGHLIRINGRTFHEITVGDEDSRIFSYAAVEIGENSMVRRAINPKWLENRTLSMPDTTYVKTDAVMHGSGGVRCGSPTQMATILQIAAVDPAALNPPETLRRP